MKPGNGKVFLVGAGPGAPDLITVRAARLLARADIVFHDALVHPDTVALAVNAETVAVGKRCGRHSTAQRFINKRLIDAAAKFNTVVRLKGGDPFVFGRGGEEALTLARAGISCEVISGVTAGIGVPAALGIPVTHRDLARGVTFVTGHTRDGGGPNWAALARTGTTLVIYMGIKRLPEITAALGVAGMPVETPAAVIQYGTTRQQRHVIATLATLAEAARDAEIGSPALIVIGRVVGLARQDEQAGFLWHIA